MLLLAFGFVPAYCRTELAESSRSAGSAGGLEDGETHQSVLKDLEELLLHINGVGPTTKYFKVKGWSKANFAADKVDCKPVSRCVLTTDGAIIL